MSARNSNASAASAPSEFRGTHVFDVTNYGKHRGLGAGIFIPSETFYMGGYAWSIRFYPGGHASEKYASPDYVAMTLELMTKDVVVTALYDMGLVDQAIGACYFPIESEKAEFDTNPSMGHSRWFMSRFMKRTELEASPFLRDDRIVIECSLAVIKGTKQQVPDDETGTAAPESNLLPRSDLADHWGKLLSQKEGADVTFMVKDKTFTAHRMVLAARSPLLKKELNWPNPGPPNYVINVANMDPEVFESLLHFIYMDAMPDMDQLDEDRRKERIGYLLFAAQTYGLDRLKVICEDILSRNLEVETVCNVLLRVYQYNCNKLKDACIDFIISDRWIEVSKTEGYKHLKTNCPSILIEILEKGRKLDNK